MNQILSQEDIERFQLNGYVRLESAFDRTLTHRVMTYIWEILEQRYGFDREDSSTWNRPTKGLIKILQANRDLWNIGDQKITYAITQLLGPSWKSPTHWGTLLHTMPESPDMWNIPTENIKVRVVELTAEPGDAVLCHPLIVHARSQNASKVPRFMLAKRIWRKQA